MAFNFSLDENQGFERVTALCVQGDCGDLAYPGQSSVPGLFSHAGFD